MANLRPSDRVVYREFSTITHGTVRKVAKVSAMIAFDDGTERRVNINGALRPETASDIQARDAKAAMRAWDEARPKAKHVTLCTRGYSNIIDGVSTHARTPDEMRKAAAELLDFAAWFERRPER